MSTTTKALSLDFPFQAKALDEDLGTFEGFASTWSLDLQNDRIVPGAFKSTIAESKARRDARGGEFLLPVLYMHDTSGPIGGIYSLEETSKGLYIRGMLDLDTAQGKRAFSGLKKGYCASFSIGYKSRRDHMKRGGVRVLEAIDLFEVSIVIFPANPEARVTGVKKAQDAWAENLVIDMQRVAAKERNQMYRVIHDDFLHGTSENERSYTIEYGRPEESRDNFEKELRAQRREDDPILGLLESGSKAYTREIEKRKKEREEKQRLQREALEAEQREREERQKAWDRETFTPEVYAELTGFELIWCRGFFQRYVANGLVTPVDEATLTVSRGDLQRMMRNNAEELEYKAISLRNKRLAQKQRQR